MSWYLYLTGGTFTLAALVLGGVDTGWTFTTPLSTHYLNTHVVTAATADLHRGFQLHLHGAEFHRDHPPDAGAGDDVVPAAAVRLVELCGFSVLMVLGTPVLAIAMVSGCAGAPDGHRRV